MLGRIRRATATIAPVEVTRRYRGAGASALSLREQCDLLVDRLTDYRAGVRVVASPAAIAGAVAELVATEGVRCAVVPPGFDVAHLAEIAPAVTIRSDEPPLSVTELDGTDAVITTCALAIAETGTVVLAGGPGQGRRSLTLLPDVHIVIVHAAQIVPTVPDAVGRLDPTRPLTWISGPSATSDIELDRVEGVHGPRRLRIVLDTGHIGTDQ
jgi:L-lactate dehydrogenase complex protein LldG